MSVCMCDRSEDDVNRVKILCIYVCRFCVYMYVCMHVYMYVFVCMHACVCVTRARMMLIVYHRFCVHICM
jgi:hypothetical protein